MDLRVLKWTPMKRAAPVAFVVTLAFLGGYVYGHLRGGGPVVAAKTARRILYYQCPMHPSYRSDHPGVAPCCNMELQPVYEGDASPPSSAAIHITPRQQELIGVQYGSVEFGPASRVIRSAARVGLNETRVAHIQTKLEGFIDRLYVQSVGETVTKGQPLVSIYNRRAYSMVQEEFLQATMDSGGMALPSAAAASPEARNALGEAVLAARQHLEMVGFTEDQIEAVARAHQPLRSFALYAPFDGTVVEFGAALNQQTSMAPLLTVADLTSVWITASLPTADAAALQPGQTASFASTTFPGKTFHGRVDRILPELDSETRRVTVRLNFDNPGLLLKPQMYGDVELRMGMGERRLTVAQSAVLDSGRTRTVFIDLGNGYLEPREVITGERLGDRVEVVRGLSAGERVVTSGNFLIDSEAQLHNRR
jgi:membrane fusion protein, copper/silver efflux system